MANPHETTPAGKPRARGLGLAFPGEPGPANAITDVDEVQVGYCTLIRGEGARRVGRGPVRTGVTALLPRGLDNPLGAVFAGSFSLNGNGELTGLAWIEESGECEGPITLTNTHSCGLARDATIRWLVTRHARDMPRFSLPVAGETYDGELNDINGFHVTENHVFEAIESAAGGPIELGSVGGGTGMICYDFKGGCGSASRRIRVTGTTFTLGVFVQANFGRRDELTVLGMPAGRHLPGGEVRGPRGGSVIAVVATDAPLLPHQLSRLARRVSLGLARTGSVAHNGSGDLFLALSTANAGALRDPGALACASFVPNDLLDPLFTAVVEATEEAVIDAMVANEPMTGCDGIEVRSLPRERLTELMRRAGRVA